MTTALWLWATLLVALGSFFAGAECCWRAFVHNRRPRETESDRTVRLERSLYVAILHRARVIGATDVPLRCNTDPGARN